MIEIENRDWRTPTASEAELIEAWKREDLRDRRPAFYFFGGIIIIAIFMLVIALTMIDGEWAQNVILILGSIVIFDSLMLIVYLSVTNRRRLLQILRGDYQIIDAVAITTLLNPSGKFVLHVKAASDELIDITVSEKFWKTITSDMPGILIQYGKNTSARKAKPSTFIPIRELDGPAEQSADQSPNGDWRLPNASEVDHIAAWTRKISRANRLPIIAVLAFLPLLLIGMLILIITGESSFDKLWPYGLVCFGLEIHLAMLFRAALRQTKQLLIGDYQIKDAVVVSKNSPRGSQRSEHYLQVRTSSGEMQNGIVGRAIHKAVTENTPGFLVLVNGEKSKKKGSDMIFIPATPLNE